MHSAGIVPKSTSPSVSCRPPENTGRLVIDILTKKRLTERARLMQSGEELQNECVGLTESRLT